MRKLILFYALSLSAFGSACVSQASGNWNVSGTWTSCAGGVPGNGDTVTIANGHTVTVPTGYNAIVGADTSTPAIQPSSTSGTGVLVVNGTLQFKGPIKQGEATWTVNQNAIVTHASTTASYRWLIGLQDSTVARLVVSGTAGNRATFNAISGTPAGGFSDVSTNNFLGVSDIEATYASFDHWGSSSSDFIYFKYANKLTFDHVLLTNCGRIHSEATWAPNATWGFTYSSSKSPASTYFLIYNGGNVAVGTGRRLFDHAYIEGTILYYGGNNGEANGLEFYDSILTGTSSTQPVIQGGGKSSVLAWNNTMVYNAIDSTGSPSGMFSGTYTRFMGLRNIATQTLQNPHFFSVNPGSAAFVFDGGIFEYFFGAGASDSGGDCVLGEGDATAANTPVIVRHVLFLPGSSGDASCSGATISAPMNNTVWTFEHNTYVSSSPSGVIGVGIENTTGYAGQWAAVRDNLVLRMASSAGYLVQSSSAITPTDGEYTNVDYNAKYNITTSLYHDVNSKFASPTPPGTHDLGTVNPGFVDSTRSFLKWGQSVDGTITTWAQIIAKFAAINDDTPSVGFTVSAAYDWIRAGWVPTNSALKNAAHDGTSDIGALPVTPPSAGITVQNVTTSNTQAVLVYKVSGATTCKVEVSTDPSYFPLANDVDSLQFTGANYDSRLGTIQITVSDGTLRYFVVGKRAYEFNLNTAGGRIVSRALAADTIYYYRINGDSTCDAGGPITGTFKTLPPAGGLTYVDVVKGASNCKRAFGCNMVPQLDWTQTTRAGLGEINDAFTGVAYKPLTIPSDFPSASGNPNLPSRPSSEFTDTDGAWSGLANIPAHTCCATVTGAHPLTIPIDNSGDSNSNNPTYVLNNMILNLTGSASASTQVNVSLKVGGLTLPYLYNPLTIGTSSATVSTRGLNEMWDWRQPGGFRLDAYDIHASTGTVNVVGTAVTLASGFEFGLNWAAGDVLFVSGTKCLIAADVVDMHHLTVQGSPACPTGSGLAYQKFPVSVVITPVGSNTLSLSDVTLKSQYVIPNSWYSGGNMNMCSDLPFTTGDGKVGFLCSPTKTTTIYFVESARNGVVRLIGTASSRATDGAGSINLGCSPNSFGWIDSHTFLCGGVDALTNTHQTLYEVSFDGNGTDDFSVAGSNLMGKTSLTDANYFQELTCHLAAGGTGPCSTITDLHHGGDLQADLATMTTANSEPWPYSKTLWTGFNLDGVDNGYAMFSSRSGQQDETTAWYVIVDGRKGSGTRGQVVAYANTFAFYPMRGGTNHTNYVGAWAKYGFHTPQLQLAQGNAPLATNTGLGSTPGTAAGVGTCPNTINFIDGIATVTGCDSLTMTTGWQTTKSSSDPFYVGGPRSIPPIVNDIVCIVSENQYNPALGCHSVTGDPNPGFEEYGIITNVIGTSAPFTIQIARGITINGQTNVGKMQAWTARSYIGLQATRPFATLGNQSSYNMKWDFVNDPHGHGTGIVLDRAEQSHVGFYSNVAGTCSITVGDQSGIMGRIGTPSFSWFALAPDYQQGSDGRTSIGKNPLGQGTTYYSESFAGVRGQGQPPEFENHASPLQVHNCNYALDGAPQVKGINVAPGPRTPILHGDPATGTSDPYTWIGATSSNPVVIYEPGHGLATGWQIIFRHWSDEAPFIDGHGGSHPACWTTGGVNGTGANGLQTVTRIDADHYSIPFDSSLCRPYLNAVYFFPQHGAALVGGSLYAVGPNWHSLSDRKGPAGYAVGWAQHMTEVSATMTTDLSTGNNTWCHNVVANLCYPSSPVGTVFWKSTNYAQGFDSEYTSGNYNSYFTVENTPGTAESAVVPGTIFSDFIVGPITGAADSVYRWFMTRQDSFGKDRQMLIHLAPGGRQLVQYTNGRVLADDSWTFFPKAEGYIWQIFAARTPAPPMVDNIDRSNFVPITVTEGAGRISGATKMFVEFGYYENGAASAFYCTQASVMCSKGSETGTDWSWGATTNYATLPTTIAIPGISGRTLYYRKIFLNSGNSVIATEDSVAIVP